MTLPDSGPRPDRTHTLWEETKEDDSDAVSYTVCNDCCEEFVHNLGLFRINRETKTMAMEDIPYRLTFRYCPFCGAQFRFEGL